MRVLVLGDRNPEFPTHREVDAALALLGAPVAAGWVATDAPAARDLAGVDGVWLLPGTPYRDDAVAYAAIGHCLDTGTPYLGTCGGFQYACVELARRAGVAGAAHAESDPDGDALVVAPLTCALYGEWRTVVPVPDTALAAICGAAPFDGYHFCGYGLADAFAGPLADAGVVVSARSQDAGVEAIELPGHPFFLATAFQPQVGSAETGRLHPLLTAFLEACARQAVAA
jgi:CTP synthase (UTP-ammonia lyase)